MNQLTEPIISENRVDEISVRKLLLKLITYLQLIIKSWYWVALGSLLLGSYFFYTTYKLVDTYPASIKVFVNFPKVDKNNAIMTEVFSKLMNNQQLLFRVFLKPQVENDPTSSVINTYLANYFELNPSGLPSKIPNNFQFKNNEVDKMDRAERQVLNDVIAKVSTPISDFSDGFISISGDFKFGFITINVSSPSEKLSILLIDEIYSEINKLLLNKFSFANQSAFSALSTETDSLSNHYKKTYLVLNKYKDKRGRLLELGSDEKPLTAKQISAINYIEKKIHRLSVDAEISKTGYLAALEHQKIAQLDRDQSAITIEELERSISPIVPFRPDHKLAAAKGGFSGGIFIVVLLIIFTMFKEVRKELYPN